MLLFYLRISFVPKLDLKDGQKIKVTDTLAEEPKISGNQQSFRMGQFEVRTERYPEYHYGESLEIVGKAKARNEYLGHRFYLLSYPEIKSTTSITSTTAITGIVGTAIRVRNRIRLLFIKYFPKPLDGIASGIVLGDKSLLPENFWQKLQQTGTLHIMVASGMNIAMFSKGLLAFLTRFLNRRSAIFCLILVIFFYSIMTGLQAPIIRAAIMVSLIYLSQYSGREVEGGRVLFLTGLIMVFVNPFWLWDVGFQLSFLATSGLVFLQPKLMKINFPIFKNENFSSSLASLLATLPILVLSFGTLNLASPLINLAVLWAIPYILQIGIFIGLAGLLWIKLGEWASYLIYPLLFYVEQAISLFAKVKIFQLELPKLGIWWAAVYYLILWWRVKKKDC